MYFILILTLKVHQYHLVCMWNVECEFACQLILADNSYKAAA